MNGSQNKSCLYSAAQIARALNRPVRSIRRALNSVEPTTNVIINGNNVKAWTLNELPKNLRDNLGQMAINRGFKTIDNLIHSSPKIWEPSIDGKKVKLSEITDHCIDDAAKLQRALLPILPKITDSFLPRSEIESIGLRDYRAIFGKSISTRQWWRLANRMLDRDQGTMNFHRIEIYLSNNIARKTKRQPLTSITSLDLNKLQTALSAVEKPSNPTAEELSYIWDQTFWEFKCHIDSGKNKVSVKRTIIKAMYFSGVNLATSLNSLKRNFNRKWKEWNEGDCKPSAIADKRKLSANEKKFILPEEDRLILLARSVERGGRISQAWRYCINEDEFTAKTTLRYITNAYSKSYVPRCVRDQVKNDSKLLVYLHNGPKQHKLNGAYISRDYSDTTAGDWYQADDATLNHYYFEETSEGISAMRGQCLLFIDVRTNYVLGYLLHSERSYNARIIREGITRVHDFYGLPREGFYFENGMWKTAHILKGKKTGEEIPLEETEQGLCEFVRFKHAQTPRAKVIERIIGILQNEMEPLPGYVGRNEMVDKYERVQKKLLEARRGIMPYDSFLLSKDQWVNELERVCERYNDEPQEGKLKGLCPREAFESLFDYTNPLVKLPGHLRYLLANHRKRIKVTRNGIRLKFKGESYWFRNDCTGEMIGKTVFAWFETEEEVPCSISVTDLKKENSIEVEREYKPPSITATSEELDLAQSQVKAQNSYGKTLYRIIQPRFKNNQMMFRPVIADNKTIELGRSIETGRKKVKSKREKETRLVQQINKHQRARGIIPNAQIRNPKRVSRGFELLEQADRMEEESLRTE